MTQSLCSPCVVRDMSEFQISPERGFLPTPDPLQRLPEAFGPWEEIARELPKLLVAGTVRTVLDAMPALNVAELGNEPQQRRGMLLLSFLGHACIWGQEQPAKRLPPSVAVPWYELSQRLGRPPVLSYASYALDNWRRLDPAGPVALGNIVLIQNFLGGVDEEWFILVHVDIEAKAAAALAAIAPAQQAVQEYRPSELEEHLLTVAAALESMHETLLHMPERCDPYIYYNRVRPYIHGWKDHPALPEGVVYEGVAAYGGQPQKFRGETGAQSSIIPALDAALGISHREDILRSYLRELRDYMPPKHQAFIAAIEQGPSVRDAVLEQPHTDPVLRDAYNACVHWLEKFRSKHLDYAASYIQKQARPNLLNPGEVGTGGTPFIPYLKKHRDETSQHTIA